MRRKYGSQHWLSFLEGHGRAGHEGLQEGAIAVIVAGVVHAAEMRVQQL